MTIQPKLSLFNPEITDFVDVILPLPIPKLFTYRVPRGLDLELQRGFRVIVPFGKGRIVTGIIDHVHQTPPTQYQAKYILEVLDNLPITTEKQLWLFTWIAQYYAAPIGLVMNVALPSGLKVSSESKIEINPEFNKDITLTEDEAFFIEIVEKKGTMPMEEAMNFFGSNGVNKALKELINKKVIIIYEKIREQYRPKIEKRIRLSTEYANQEKVITLVDQLSSKQQEVVLAYLKLMPLANLILKNGLGVSLKDLKNEGISESSLNTLIKNEIFIKYEKIVPRFELDSTSPNIIFELSEPQKQAADSIFECFEKHQVTLFHGITGSGKTEVYIHMIQQVLESGSQVLLLLPEIALTTQMVIRLKKVFGESMGVYHSKFSDNERVEIYRGVLEGKISFVLGVRSSIFLPFTNLGFIIVDEEHETSYKQSDPAPRYHARDVAIMMGHQFNAKVLLGSATPSLETYYKAKQGQYGLVELFERYGNAQLPNFIFADTKQEKKSKTMKGNFSSVLLKGIHKHLEQNEQVIIFQNRRGYSPYLNCDECNWIGECNQCAVSLTYHLFSHQLVCHYCGYKETTPKACPACGSNKITTVGTGTEKIEDELKLYFPNAIIKRMDYDTTRTKNAYSNIIHEFSNGEIDILVGTQMLSKGLDFDKVSLVGIFDADKIIHFPDFRATERAFQMITQVSGRAGRKGKNGEVIIQTADPNHPVLLQIVKNNYLTFYEKELYERKKYNYPPFSRLIKLTFKHIKEEISHAASGKLSQTMANKIGHFRVLGPEKALIERIRNQYIYEVYLKLEKSKVNINAIKQMLLEEITNLLAEKEFKSVKISINVDAQ